MPTEVVDGNAYGGEPDDGCGHRRDGFAPDGTHAGAEREREEHVRGGDDALYVEPAAAEPVAEYGDEWLERPYGEHAERNGCGRGHSEYERELCGDPAQSADGLGPDQPVGAGFELASDEGRTPEHAGEQREHEEARGDGREPVVLPLQVRDRLVQSVPLWRQVVSP